MSLTEKLAYIQGLCEGMELDGTTKEGKVLLAIVDLLDDLTDTVSQLDNDIDQIFDEIDAIDEDLTDVEDALLYDEEDEDEDDCGCGHHHHHHGGCGCGCHDDEDEEWEDDEDLTDLYDEENPLYEITCPKCGDIVCMDEDMLFSPDCACPNCGTTFEIEFDEECDCEDCDCEDEE
ncbi:MAG: hypothetical protein IKU54_06220 [Oscillospiraceae bacterium]|nr:hypothetical protein [Oscillospiraceae bacterium]